MYNYPLGRKVPDNFDHVSKHPYTIAQSTPMVNRVLALPSWHWTHAQGRQGSCVGHGSVMERAITNTAQNRIARLFKPTRRYDPIDLWNQAKLVDPWSDTNPGDDNGTTVSAGYDVLRNRGPVRVKSMKLVNDAPTPVGSYVTPDIADGIMANRWAISVDQVRTAIASGQPCTIGVNWYDNFDFPEGSGKEVWIGRGNLGQVRGGHCVCIYGASDTRQAVRIKNSWGRDYPLVWMPYTALSRLINEDGEVTLVTDR